MQPRDCTGTRAPLKRGGGTRTHTHTGSDMQGARRRRAPHARAGFRAGFRAPPPHWTRASFLTNSQCVPGTACAQAVAAVSLRTRVLLVCGVRHAAGHVSLAP